MNIFVTGATGFIGKTFVPCLLSAIKKDDRVYVLLRRRERFEDKRVVELYGSLEGIKKFKDEISSCQHVFHLAANAAFGDDFDYDCTNYEPTVQIVEILKKSECLRNFIYISTIGAVDRMPNDDCRRPLNASSAPNPRSSYGVSKLKSEKYIKGSGIPFTVIRPTWVYGKDMRVNSHINKFVSMAYGNSVVSKFNFPGRVSLIHVDNLTKALVNSLYNSSVIGKTYFAEIEALSIGSIFKIIYEQIHQKNIRQINLSLFDLFFRKFHGKLPLMLSSLFIDYLYARDESFRIDFKLQELKSFYEYIDDVISTNIHNGYWIITGANSGIGHALAKRLHRLNKKLVLVDKNVHNLNEFSAQIVFKVDLSNLEHLSELAKAISKYRVFCLINNAGVGFKGGIEELDLHKIKKTIDVNVNYPILFTKFMLHNLINNGSIIVNIASSCAYNPLPNMSIYSASKAFLVNWSESLAYELRKKNKVITVSPSGTYSNFQRKAGVKVVSGGKGLLTTEYVADRIIKAVYANNSIAIFGKKTKILLMISKFIPRKYNIYIWGKMFEALR